MWRPSAESAVTTSNRPDPAKVQAFLAMARDYGRSIGFEGTYLIDRRNPNSEFHLSLGINYPRDADRRSAKEAGVSPGGDIFIHGRPWKNRKGGRDWTAGCIAVTNREMEEIYAMVRNGTPITINP